MTNSCKPVAICGIALRLPGGINSTQDLWEALQDGKDLRGPVPESRYSKEGFSNGMGSKGAIETQHGYFLDQDISCFDASHFSLTEEEIRRTDPQQRLLLEVVKECFDSAGLIDYRGSNTGCYVGTFSEDWLHSQAKEDQHSGGYIMSGQVDMMLANRVSYENDLRGPSMVIKTGCSASLISLHEACRALQMSDCVGAVVAGTNLILGPTTTAAMSSEGILSPEGSCKTFDSEADGFARGEAVVAVYLRTLDSAVQERLPIRAVITNTGVNSNGRSQNILQPNMEAQIELMRKVYNDIGADPARTAYVECHGTGTPTGDPIEAAAVGQVFGDRGVYIGSIKPNMGHSEGASGISSLLKSIVMLEKGMIVPNIKFRSPNPKIDFEKYRLQVPQELLPWPRDRDLRVSINSFGIGGSNAHVLVEHPYTHLSELTRLSDFRPGSPQLLLMSAAIPKSLQYLSERYREYAKGHPDSLLSLAYTLSRHREHHKWRTFAVCGEGSVYTTAPIVRASANVPGVTMVFSGQGAQWAQMGHELLQHSTEFLQAIETMDSILQNVKYPPTWSIKTELQTPVETSRVHRAEISQPLCTALQIALLHMFQAGGVEPTSVVGHSSGEIAAAYASGAIDMEEAIIIAYYRGLVMNSQTSKGCMAAISLDAVKTRGYLRSGVVIACENSPSSTTISGDEDVLSTIIDDIKTHENGVLARRLNVNMAYHSHHMKDLATRYLELLREELGSRKSRREGVLVPMFSSVEHQDNILSQADFTPEYWVANLVSPVKFHTAMINVLCEKGHNLLIEVGPHSTLAGPLQQISSSLNVPYKYCPTLIRHSNSTQSMLTAFGTLYQNGLPLKWQSLIPDATVLSDLPVYPWDHTKSYWYESRVSKAWRLRKFGHHELLGLRVPQTTDLDPVWRVMLDVENVPWLLDHKVRGNIVLPFAAYVCMAGEAFRQTTGIGEGYSVRGVSVVTALVLDVDKSVEVVTALHSSPSTGGIDPQHVFSFTVSSYTGSTWIKHCAGLVTPPGIPDPIKATTDTLPRKVIPNTWYGAMARLGLEYGPSFRRVEKLSTSTQDTFAVAKVSDYYESKNVQCSIHPTAIDASFQVGLAALTKGLVRNFTVPQMPTFIEELDVLQRAASIDCAASYGKTSGELSVDGTDTNGKPCLRLRGMRLTSLADDSGVEEEDQYGGARLRWIVDSDFHGISSLVNIPAADNHDKQLIEELALLCIVESTSLLKDIEPSMPHLLKYRAWLEWVTDEASDDKHSILEHTSALVSLTTEERSEKINQLFQEAFSSSSMSAFAEAIMRVHDNVRALFTGTVDALELLLRDNLLARIYDAVSFDYSDLVCAFSNSVPNLRILEVGAGTGGSTELILRGMQHPTHFPRYSKYTFTDISAGFFSKACERFASAPNMEFKVFDISQHPFEQGFEPDSYDLILAANVVHATPILAASLHHLELLLAPGGKLVLTEFCTSFRAPNYIYGNFSGWWLGEADDRKWEPYVSIARWDEELKAVGLGGASSVVLDSAEPWQYCGTIVSQKPAGNGILTEDISILCENPESLFNHHLLEGLRQEGLRPRFIALRDASTAEGDIIASLDLERSLFENISEENLRLFQDLCGNLGDSNLLWLLPPSQVACVDPRGSQSLGMIRTARFELDLSITTLEINSNIPNCVRFVIDVFQKVRSLKDHGVLAPDREYAVHENLVMVGRYQPFKLHRELSDHQSPSEEPRISDLIRFDPKATYMMTGGLGGLGRAIAVWLAERGARHLLFLSPTAGSRPKDTELFIELESFGCSVVAVQGVTQNEADVQKAIHASGTPIKGVLHLSMQLRDAFVLDLTHDDWTTVISPKVDGAWNLHRNLGDDLDFFIMTSSLSTVFNQPGQSNYNAANTFMESLCQYRHSLNLSASVLNVCPIEGIGYVAENSEARRKLKSQGHWFLDECALLKFLELAILRSNSTKPKQAGIGWSRSWVNQSHIVMGLRSDIPMDDPSNRATWRRDRRMGLYHNNRVQRSVQMPSGQDKLRTFLARVTDQPDLLNEASTQAYLAAEIGKRIFSFIMRSDEDMDISLTLANVHLDSLMAIELRRWWKQIFRVEVSVLEILNSGTIAGLGDVAVRSLQKRLSDAE
ncbi:KR domain-containing protein [Melanomma pulvis-pyrius CBS 109.77]|uniref:KR domain-containing protein n=1 Tax=Melanomma pulvis-pyrius CBS 109.77 TaxID=1314802 RepID=A0A6A6X7R6_9PLEO|nr:KR domain-containing protein [Melanomma pulvis-pyrius CBS 109.77]